MKEYIYCPHCNSNKTMGDSHPVTTIGQANEVWDVEQAMVCLECKKPFVAVYKFLTAIPMEKSSRFSPDRLETG